MSDKPKREITLGEMQDECKRVFGGCALCRVKNECVFNTIIQPRELDLSDPPRFTEAQMAFLRGLYEIGARKIIYNPPIQTVAIKDVYGLLIAEARKGLLSMDGSQFEELDLAEMFGKEKTE